jgi:hypothetical protein
VASPAASGSSRSAISGASAGRRRASALSSRNPTGTGRAESVKPPHTSRAITATQASSRQRGLPPSQATRTTTATANAATNHHERRRTESVRGAGERVTELCYLQPRSS